MHSSVLKRYELNLTLATVARVIFLCDTTSFPIVFSWPKKGITIVVTELRLIILQWNNSETTNISLSYQRHTWENWSNGGQARPPLLDKVIRYRNRNLTFSPQEIGKLLLELWGFPSDKLPHFPQRFQSLILQSTGHGIYKKMTTN